MPGLYAGILLCRTTTELINHVPCGRGNSDPPFTSLGFINDPAGTKTLMLCGSFLALGKSRNYYICIPSTRQFLMLPPSDAEGCDDFTAIFGVHLAFDPSKSPHHYQVVCVRNSPLSTAANDHHQIEIYSSETRNWRLSGSPFGSPFDMVFNNGVLWNARIHWISPTGASLCFDIIQEQLKEMPSLPSNEKWSKRRLRYVGESGGHLHLIEIYGSATAQFQACEMAKDYSSWIPKYQVDITAIINAFPKIVRSYPDAHDSILPV